MLKIWGKVMKNNKIIKDEVVISEKGGSYQDNLKECLKQLCYNFEIETPYWLPANVEEYNLRRKVAFNKHNFIDEIDFDKLVLEELDSN